SLKNVISADSSAFNPSMTYTINSAKQAHPWSSWLSYKGVVYYSHESGMIGVPSMNVLSANGGTTILPMNQADIEVLNSSSGIPILEMMDSRLY
ncbi:MAG TPA: hypothetical protein VE973_04220, partial [Candidatus Limnocylindria bacterium]|nr:hypothetical protein [Candidatus Limnocylindria bacterium]